MGQSRATSFQSLVPPHGAGGDLALTLLLASSRAPTDTGSVESRGLRIPPGATARPWNPPRLGGPIAVSLERLTYTGIIRPAQSEINQMTRGALIRVAVIAVGLLLFWLHAGELLHDT